MNLEQTLSFLGVVEPEKVKFSRARARTHNTHTHTRKCVTKCRILSRVLSGRSRQVAHLHKKFDFGLSRVAHLHLLLSGPLLALEKSQNMRELVRESSKWRLRTLAFDSGAEKAAPRRAEARARRGKRC